MSATIDGGVGETVPGRDIRGSGARWVLVGIVLLGTGLILHDLGHDSLWVDEVAQIEVSSGSVGRILKDVMEVRGQPPFYWVALHFFMPFGGSEFAVRMLSAMFGVVNIVLVYKLGQALFGHREGIVAAFLMALSPLHLSHAQDARMYTAMVCFSTLSLYWLYRAMRENEPGQWLAYAGSSIVNLWNHAYAAFVFGAEVVFAGVWLAWELLGKARQSSSRGMRSKRLLAFVLSNAGIAGAWVPMLLTFRRLSTRVGLGSGGHLRNLPKSVTALVGVVKEFAGGGGPLLTAFVALMVIGVVGCLKRRKELVLLFLSCVGMPVLGFFALKTDRGFFSVRYVIFYLPLFLVFVSRGVLATGEVVACLLCRRRGVVGGSS